ncbi:hypothetical protein EDB80DRAFT_899889 [Ilyonectria destructans]|nr:hypothetical protein EDB80DRAFT_899889 [Ilyonectria destructans]
MTGSVGWRGRQPHSSIRAPSQDTSEPVETTIEPDDLRAMSPRMTSEDVEALEREMHTELRRLVKTMGSAVNVRCVRGWPSWELLTDVCSCGSRHAKALQDSLLLIFNRVEAVKKGHEKLDSNNKLLQKYIGDLTSMR